jgi:hypothetical protein
MKRYEISYDYIKKFAQENKNVNEKTIKPLYFSLNDDKAILSSYPYTMEQAKYGLVIFSYTYTVITQLDYSLAPLFFNSNGGIEDYIVIDGWKLYFSKPITSMYRNNGTYVFMEKGILKLEMQISLYDVENEFPRIWELFSVIRKCCSQTEIDCVKKLYDQGIEIENLKTKNLRAETEIDSLKMLTTSYKQLLDKISSIVVYTN